LTELPIQAVFEQVLSCLASRNIPYMIMGGFAVRALDLAYLRDWATRLGISDRLAVMLREAGMAGQIIRTGRRGCRSLRPRRRSVFP
jgi:hypothetical protein